MAEHGTATDKPTSSANGTDTLELRVRRLEDVVAALQDTRELEERVTQRVTERVRTEDARRADREGRPLLLSASRHLLTTARETVSPIAQERSAAPSPERRGPRFLLDSIAELRAMVRMYVDPRYRLSWSARVLPFVLLALFVTSKLWIPFQILMPDIVVFLLMKAIDLVLAFLLYKILSREARWYRDQGFEGPVIRPFLARFLRVRLVFGSEVDEFRHDSVRR